MNRTDFANAPRNKKTSYTNEYQGTLDLKKRIELNTIWSDRCKKSSSGNLQRN